MPKEIDWENNRFEVSGGPRKLKITPKQSGTVIIPKMQTKFFWKKLSAKMVNFTSNSLAVFKMNPI